MRPSRLLRTRWLRLGRWQTRGVHRTSICLRRSLRVRWLASCFCLLSCCSALPATDADEIAVKGLYPPAAELGEQLQVSLRGEITNWPPSVWVDRRGVRFQPAEESGELTVTVEPEAKPGVYWLRLYTADAVSKMLPFYVGRLPQQIEQEPNDRLAAGKSVSLPQAVVGRLEKRGDVDTYRVILAAGETLQATVLARRPFGSPMDAVLQIGRDRWVLDQNDDARGIDPQLQFTAEEAGEYFVRLFAFPETPNSSIAFSGAEDYIYRLELTKQPRFEFALPAELSVKPVRPPRPPRQTSQESHQVAAVGRAATQAVWHPSRSSHTIFHDHQVGVLEVPSESHNGSRRWLASNRLAEPPVVTSAQLPLELWGQLTEQVDTQPILLELEEGERVSLIALSRPFLQELDPRLQIFDTRGKQLAENDDSNKQRRAALNFKAPAAGRYLVRLSDATGRISERSGYLLQFERQLADFRLDLGSTDFLLLPPGKPAELTVSVDRRHGYQEAVEVRIAGLPEGVTCEPIVSEMKQATEKQVVLQLKTAKPFASGVIEVIGRGPDGTERRAMFTLAADQRQHAQLWLQLDAE